MEGLSHRLILKRVLTPVFTLFVFLAFLVPPANASSTNDYRMFDVLEFTTVNDSGQNVFWTSGEQRTIYFTLPFQTWIVYVDLLMDLGGTKPTSITVNIDGFETTAKELTMKHVSGNVYRMYGYTNARIGNRLDVNITKPSGESYYEVLSLKISGSAMHQYDDNVRIFHDNVTVDTWTPGSDRLLYQFDGGSAANGVYRTFSMQYWILNWERYDYFDIVAVFNVGQINSVSAYCGNTLVPLDYQVIDTGNNENSNYMVICRIDISGLDRTGDDPYIVVTGTAKFGVNDTFFYSGTGYIEQTYINPFIVWLQKIYNELSIGFDNVVDAIYATSSSDQEDQISGAETQASEMENLIEDLEQVTKPDLDDIESDVDDIVSGDAVAIATSGLAVLMNNPVLTPLFSLCMLFSTAGYVLFGKR